MITRMSAIIGRRPEAERERGNTMTSADEWTSNLISEFRSNQGHVGGQFEGAPLVLIHHHGRKSGQEYVAPTMYMPDAKDGDSIYVFASNAGRPTHPNWYYNLTTAQRGTVEVGTDTYDVSVREVSGEERDRVYAEHASRFPNFTEYERKTAGIRTIPVLELKRIAA